MRAVEGEGATGSDIASGSAAAVDSGEGGPLADVRFEYDSAALTDAARAALGEHARGCRATRDARVTVEGHCDERGTVEYNLALGEQRARAARDYLVSLGVAADRLRTVSYGKERPLDTGRDRGGLRQEPPRPLRASAGRQWALPALGLRRRGRDGAGGRIVIRRLVAAFAVLAAAAALPAPATAANKDMERLQLQVATLQSQLAEIQRRRTRAAARSSGSPSCWPSRTRCCRRSRATGGSRTRPRPPASRT